MSSAQGGDHGQASPAMAWGGRRSDEALSPGAANGRNDPPLRRQMAQMTDPGSNRLLEPARGQRLQIKGQRRLRQALSDGRQIVHSSQYSPSSEIGGPPTWRDRSRPVLESA